MRSLASTLAWIATLVAIATAGVSLSGDVAAQTKKPGAAKKWKGKGKKPAEPADEAAAGEAKADDAKESKGAGTEQVKKATSSKGTGPDVVETKSTGDAGVKTYKFGPVEVEGRLKSPQVVYFMRRVRAEFAAGALGHRSFMRELSDTRRSPALK